MKNRISWSKIFVCFALCVGIIVFSVTFSYLPFAGNEKNADSVDGPPVVLFIGDSYTAGVGVTENERWSTLLSSRNKWIEINAAMPGQGYVRRPRNCGLTQCPFFLERIIELEMLETDIVILAGGQNDIEYAAKEPARTRHVINKTIERLSSSFHNSDLVVIGPTSPNGNNQNAAKLTRWISEACSRNDVDFIDLYSRNVIDQENLLNDRLHVNQSGHLDIYRRVQGFFRSKLGVG